MPPKSSLDARLAEMKERGISYAEMAAPFGVSAAATWARLNRQSPSGIADDCHGDCGRWIEHYRVGRQIVTPPDHCGGCARALSEQAKAEEEMRVRSFLQRALAG